MITFEHVRELNLTLSFVSKSFSLLESQSFIAF